MRVVLAEDEALLREGLTLVLARLGFEVVATAQDPDDLLRKVRAHHPDVVVTDVRMPPTHTDEGLRAAAALRAEQPDLALLILSHHVQVTYARELFTHGATGLGYLLKQRVMAVDRLGDDLRHICAGGTVIDPEVVSALMAGGARSGLLDLTPRQAEVLALIAEGRSNAAVARHLGISEKAVVRQAANVYDVLGIPGGPDDHRRVQAVVRYLTRAV